MVLTWRFVLLTAAAAIPLLRWPGWSTAGLVLLGLLLVAVVDFFLAGPPTVLTFQRTPGPTVRLGDPTHCDLSVGNTARAGLRLHIRDAWPPGAGAENTRTSFTLPAGDTVVHRTRLLPVRRGVIAADRVTVRTFSVLRLVGRQKSLEVPAAVRVLPAFVSRKHLPSKTRKLRELDGRTAVMVRGMGTEFDSLRDYVEGDDIRSVDWRATARARHLVVRTWRPERDRRVLIVLDSSRLAARRCADGTVFDAAMEATLLLTALAAGAGDRIDVLVADARVRAHITSITARDPLHDLSVELTPVFPELISADWDLIASRVLAAGSRHSLVVLVTALDEPTVAEDLLPVLPALAARNTLAIASVADPQIVEMSRVTEPDTARTVYRTAAARTELLSTTSVRANLRSMGVHSVHSSPEDLAPDLADLYIALKSTGRL